MLAIDKKKKFIKEYLRPEFKTLGFKTIKNHWYKNLDDGILIVKLQNDYWGSNSLGSDFSLEICFGEKDTPKDNIPVQFNKQHGLKNSFFSTELLPYKGFLDLHIDGVIFYTFYSDEDNSCTIPCYDEQAEDLQVHLDKNFFSIIENIGDMSSFQKILRECENKEDRTMNILRFLSIISYGHIDNISIDMNNDFHFTEEEILMHTDWLKFLCERKKSDFESTKIMALDLVNGKYMS